MRGEYIGVTYTTVFQCSKGIVDEASFPDECMANDPTARTIQESLRILPEKNYHSAETAVRAEAPRGESFYYIASDGPDLLLGVKIRMPSIVNMPTGRLMVPGATLADVPLIQASIDPCYSCSSR